MGAVIQEVKRIAVACETCGFGQRGDIDGDLKKAKAWDGKTVAEINLADPKCPCGHPAKDCPVVQSLTAGDAPAKGRK
jgi:hypothetical protein